MSSLEDFNAGDEVRVIDENLDCYDVLAVVNQVYQNNPFGVRISFLTDWARERWPRAYGFHPNQLELYKKTKPNWEI